MEQCTGYTDTLTLRPLHISTVTYHYHEHSSKNKLSTENFKRQITTVTLHYCQVYPRQSKFL